MNLHPKRTYILILAGCLFTYIFYLVFEYFLAGGVMGVPLDDTWIHFQYAENFARGYFFHYNPGEPAAGTTSPLYVVVMAAFSFIIKNFIINSIFLSALFHLLCCFLIYKISFTIFLSYNSLLKGFNSPFINPQSVSFLIALLTVFSGRFAWSGMSGMETTMFTFFCLLGLYYHIKNLQQKSFTLLPSIFFALATVSRPEGYLLFALYLFDVVINLIRYNELKTNISKLAISIIIYASITLPYLIFSYKYSGYLFPNTFRGQGGGFNIIPDFNYLRISAILFIRDNVVIAILYLISIVFYLMNLKKYFSGNRYLNLVFLWIILLPAVSSFIIPNWRHHGRYLIPLIPFVNLAAMFMFFNLLHKKRFIRIREFVSTRKAGLSMILAASIVYYIVYAVALGKNTGNINDQQVKLAEWVHENVGRDETIALNDIGAITFINKNRVVDMAGLITPEFLRYRKYQWEDNLDSMNYLLKKNNVSYIIIYDEWFKEYLDKYRSSLTFVMSAFLENNTICGGSEMKVYKTNFNTKKD